MLRRRVRSALYFDYENIGMVPEHIARVVAWLEDGRFDTEHGQSRKFLTKRVYWNSSAELHRDAYKALGFEVVLCEKFATLKNGADIRMAMDVVEETLRRPKIDEYILLTRDTDFVPVLQRIGDRGKKSIIVVNEASPQSYTAYRQHADAIIPYRLLLDAREYAAPRRGLFARLGFARKSRSSPAAPPLQSTPTPTAAPTSAKRPAIAESRSSSSPPVPAASPATPMSAAVTVPSAASLAAALDRVIKVTSRKPKEYTAARQIEAELKTIPGFKKVGAGNYFGTGSYRALAAELAKLDDRLRVNKQYGGGTGVMYVPRDET